MNNQKYWEKRAARELYDELEKAEDVAEELKKVYLLGSAEITKEAQKIARRFQLKHKLTEKDAKRLLSKVKDKNDIQKLIQEMKAHPEMAELAAELESQAYAARIRRLQATQAAMDAVAAGIFAKARGKMKGVLERIGKSSFFHTIFGIQKKADAAFGVNPIDQKRLEKVISRNWSGQNYSKRLWKDTERLAAAVKEQILLEILTGKREHDIAQGIADRFSVGYNEARRLIRTESCYVSNQMQIEAYKETGVEKYIYLAVLDLRTSKICQSLDKKTFKVSEAQAGKNLPPMHPWCRSTTMAWMPPELLAKLKQQAWDPVEKKSVTVPGDMTYQQWYDKYVKGGEKPAEKAAQSRTEAPKAGADGGHNLTREQYGRYKDRLGDDFPFTYEEFIKLKADKAKWAEYQAKYKAAKRKKLYKDITDEWYKDAVPGSHEVEYLKEIEIDGKMHTVDGRLIKYKTDKNARHEQRIGQMLADDIGGPVTMRPEINEPKGHPSADLEFNGNLYDIKTLGSEAGANTMYNRVKKKKRQTDRFIVDITAPELSDEMVQAQIEKIFWSKETNFVKEIVIVKDYKVVRVSTRA